MSTPVFTEGPTAYTEEWMALRVFDAKRTPPIVFGASSAASLLGLSNYGSPMSVFLTAAGLKEPIESNLVMRIGHSLENVILYLYREETLNDISRPLRMYQSAAYPWIGATLDGITSDEMRVVEAKSSSRFMYKPGDKTGKFFTDEDDGIPTDYQLQVQQQMLVCGAQIADVAVLFDRNMFKIYSIKASPKIHQKIIEKTKEMLDRLRDDNPPPIGEGDKHPLETVKELYSDFDESEQVILPADFDSTFETYVECKQKIDELKKEKDLCLARIIEAVGVAKRATVEGSHHSITRSKVRGTLWNQDDIDRIHVGDIKRRAYTRNTIK